MPGCKFHLAVVAVCWLASSPGVAWIAPGSGGDALAGAMRAGRGAETPAAALERMLAAVARDANSERPPATDGPEGSPDTEPWAPDPVEAAILRASDAQASDSFGTSVAISGDTVIVGRSGRGGGEEGDGSDDGGAAYVFEPDQGGPGNWGDVAVLTPSDAQAGDSFGSSVAISGDTVIVGANGEDGGVDDPLSGAGAAYVFARDQGGANNWGEVAKLTASDAQASVFFGASVAISGDTAIVGARFEDGGAGDMIEMAGAVYVFGRDEGGGDNWGEVAKVTASDAESGDHFGVSVAISGDTAIVGARFEDGGAGDTLPSAGAAYIFQFSDGSGWLEVEKLTASNAGPADEFGASVAISGDRAIVGARLEDGGAGNPLNGAGAAYVFERDQGGTDNWGEVAKLAASDAQVGDFFGISVAISADTAIVGADDEDGGVGSPLDRAGAAYVFGRDEGGADGWGEVAKLTASDAQALDEFGGSVAISEGITIVGALFEDGGAGDPLPGSGAAYVFRDSLLRFFIAGLPSASGASTAPHAWTSSCRSRSRTMRAGTAVFSDPEHAAR